MFEKRSMPLISQWAFFKRLGRSILCAVVLTVLSLMLGMVGYRIFEHLSWIDSFLNAAMILGGMGEIDSLRTFGGKVFAGCYALYSGLVVVASMGIILAPVFHRILHRFHAENH